MNKEPRKTMENKSPCGKKKNTPLQQCLSQWINQECLCLFPWLPGTCWRINMLPLARLPTRVIQA